MEKRHNAVLACLAVGVLGVFAVFIGNRSFTGLSSESEILGDHRQQAPQVLTRARVASGAAVESGQMTMEPALPPKHVLSPDLRVRIEKERRDRFGRAIRGMNLKPEDEAAAWRYLIGRLEAEHIAKKVAADMDSGLIQALREAWRQVDDEAKASLAPALYLDLSRLVAAESHLLAINQWFAPGLEKAGVPLRDDQFLPLAKAFLASYGSGWNPNASADYAKVDGSGLLAVDYTLIDAASSALSPLQLAAFRDRLVAFHAHVLASRK